MPNSPKGCVFCDGLEQQIVAESALCIAIRDKFQVTTLHSLIIPKRHIEDYFNLTFEEVGAIHELARACQAEIQAADLSVKGFNFGVNIGRIAGQKIDHVHVHLIPRRAGDVAPPPARPDMHGMP
jgi:ATP adenylyltransferase